eukprot:532761_1
MELEANADSEDANLLNNDKNEETVHILPPNEVLTPKWNKFHIIYIIGIIMIITLLTAIVILLAMLLDINKNTHYYNNNVDNILNSSCDSANIDMNVAFDKTSANKLNIYQSPNRVLPGMQFFTYSYNLLQGKPPFDLLLAGDYHQIFKLTFDSNKVSAGSKAYLVPDQLDLPAITGTCESQSKSTSIGSSTSSSSLYTAAQATSNSNSFDSSVSGSGWGFTANAGLRMSASHSRSQSVSTSLSQAKEGKSESQYTYSKALLYSARIRWHQIHQNFTYIQDLIDFVKNLSMHFDLAKDTNSVDIRKLAVDFIGIWGTHVLKLGSMGSYCSQTSFFQSSYSYQSYEQTSTTAKSQNNDYSGSVSGGGKAYGFSASVSAAYAYSSGSDYDSSAAISGEQSQSAEYSVETTYCAGEVDISLICGSMLGINDEPALVSYQLQPIYELGLFNERARNIIKNTTKAIMEGGVDVCGGIGIPAANYNFWHNQQYLTWDGSDYTVFWDQTICFDQYMVGLTMIKTGDNYTNPLTTPEPYIRREYSQINYLSFCPDDEINAVFALQAIPGLVAFGIELTEHAQNSFTSYFWVNADQSTDTGAASYFLYCSDLSEYIYSSIVEVPAHDSSTQTVIASLSNANLMCLESGYSLVKSFVSRTMVNAASSWQQILTNTTNTNSTDIKFRITSGQSYDSFKFTYIALCNKQSDRIIAVGNYFFNYVDDFNSSPTLPTIAKQLISYNNGICKNVKVFIGFNGIWSNCNIAVWAENPTSNSFEIVLGVWGVSCTLSPYPQGYVAFVDYMVLCAGF